MVEDDWNIARHAFQRLDSVVRGLLAPVAPGSSDEEIQGMGRRLVGRVPWLTEPLEKPRDPSKLRPHLRRCTGCMDSTIERVVAGSPRHEVARALSAAPIGIKLRMDEIMYVSIFSDEMMVGLCWCVLPSTSISHAPSAAD